MDAFFISVLGFSGGVMLESLLPLHAPAFFFLLLLAVLSLALSRLRAEREWLLVALLLSAAALGAGRTMLAPHALPQHFAQYVGGDATFEGVVVRNPDVRETSERITVRVAEAGETTSVLAVIPLYPPVLYGDRVRISGEAATPEPFDTDGGRTFRYDHYLEKDGIFLIMPRASVTVIAPPSGLLMKTFGFLYSITHAFARGIEAALPEPHAGLAEGLLTGGKQGLGKSLLDAFTVSGLVQIVVLSGYNVAVVADAVMKGLSFLPRRLAFGAAGFGIMLFVIASGSGSSAVRAGIMACLALYARGSGRTYDALRGLAAALLLMLVWNPFFLAFDPGFQLSAAATLGLILGTPVIEPYVARYVKSAFWREGIATTTAAQAFVLPLLLYQTGNLSLVSFVTNLLAMPAVPAAMAASLFAGTAGVIVPAFAPAFGLPAYALLSYLIAIAKSAAALPLAHFVIPSFPFALVALMYALLFYALALSKRASHTFQLRLSKNASM
jgi:competence protein ComEC